MIVFSIAIVVNLGGHDAAASGMTVPAPCSDTPAQITGLRPCATVLKGPTGVFEMLKKRISDSMDSIYRDGVDPNPMASPTAAGAQPGTPFGPTFCNLVPGPYNNNRSEISTNRMNRSCGNPLTVVLYDRGRRIRFEANNPGAETLETGYLRGSYGAALTCFSTALMAEIERDKKIEVSTACRAMGDDMAGLAARTDDLFKGIRENLAAHGNLADIANCISNGRAPSPRPGDPDVGPLRQSAQQLCAARLQLEAMFTQLAVCEAFSRAGLAYQAVVALPNSRKAHSDAIFDNMVEACKNCDGPRPSPIPGQEDAQAQQLESMGNNCVNRCYLNNLPRFLRTRFEGYWPSNPTSTAACRASGV